MVPLRLSRALPVVRGAPAWSTLDTRDRGTRFIALPVKGVLNSPASTQMGFWSVNPYIGCEFGCAYCYARETHRWTVERATTRLDASHQACEISHLAPEEAFERRILVKQDVAAVLARTLDPSKLEGQPLIIGTATDPYQPAERRFRQTRSILETLRQYHGLRLGVITKSPLITRDLDVLSELARRHRLTINLSLASLDGALLRRLEPRTPTPRARLRALRALADAGIETGLLIAPILPGLTDSRPALRELLQAARDAGAAWASGVPLRMGPATRRTLLPWLARNRPDLYRRYQRHYGARSNASHPYQRGLQARINALRTEVGIAGRGERRHAGRKMANQLALWG
jgi:DNA repair photolyase